MRDRPRPTLAPVWAWLRRVLVAVTVLGMGCSVLACQGAIGPQSAGTRVLPHLPTLTAEPTIPAPAIVSPAQPDGRPTEDTASVATASPQAPVAPPPTKSLTVAPDTPLTPESPLPTAMTVAESVVPAPTPVPTETRVIEPTTIPVIPTETPPPETAADPDAGKAEDMLDALLNMLDNADSLDDLLD